MECRVIMAAGHYLPEKSINKELAELGDGWHIVSASTTATVFNIERPRESLGEVHSRHETYFVTTVVVEKNAVVEKTE